MSFILENSSFLRFALKFDLNFITSLKKLIQQLDRLAERPKASTTQSHDI